eukprot:GILK01005188.1.p1 GENE.GILK01005188.1~~GILK01005188.1.p1  ORF type:complete len:593 (-),score=112.50 GILK01005188.1:181-1884(-)
MSSMKIRVSVEQDQEHLTHHDVFPLHTSHYSLAKVKMDEFFLRWLALPHTAELVKTIIEDIKMGKTVQTPHSPNFSSKQFATTSFTASPPSPPSKPRSPTASLQTISHFAFASGERPPKSPTRSPETSPSHLNRFASSSKQTADDGIIPRFYFPDRSDAPAKQEMQQVSEFFSASPKGLTVETFGPIVQRLCGLPSFFATPLFKRIDTANSGLITQDMFLRFWRSDIQGKSTHQRFFNIIKRPQNSWIEPDDFRPYLKALLEIHPGFQFLGAYGTYHERYTDVVIYRIFYVVDRDDDGRITMRELRKSNLVETFLRIQDDEINNVRDYFSYEHFYVLYCKFFELDGDQDFVITKEEFQRHDSHSLNKRAVERIFSNVPRRLRAKEKDTMVFEDFVWYLLSEEGKMSERAIEYWFKVVDLDGDGIIKAVEMQYFYEEQVHRLECLNHEAVSFPDIICQLNDMIHPEVEGEFRLDELKKRRHQAGTFFNVLLNLNKFVNYEQRDPFALKQEMAQNPDWSDWDRYANVEYQRLVMEEENTEDSEEIRFDEMDSVDPWGHSGSTFISEAPF